MVRINTWFLLDGHPTLESLVSNTAITGPVPCMLSELHFMHQKSLQISLGKLPTHIIRHMNSHLNIVFKNERLQSSQCDIVFLL